MKYIKLIIIVINVLLIALCLKFYLDYSLVYETQVHEMKILYPDDQDVVTRGNEIENLFFFDKLVIIGVVLNLILTILVFKKKWGPVTRVTRDVPDIYSPDAPKFNLGGKTYESREYYRYEWQPG